MKSHYYLLSIICALCSVSADAAVRVGNASRSYASGYQQVNAQREQVAMAAQQPIATTQSADMETNLPVRVANQELAQKLSRGETDSRTSIERLESCAMIYPNGEFAWDSPTVGTRAGTSSTCVAVVELRVPGSMVGSNQAEVTLAHANLAAGDAFKCNISEFPEATYTQAAGAVTFPADNPPTRDDVVKVLNQEQKQNAGLRIAAGALVGSLAGNAAGKNEVGQDGLFGTGRDKTKSTVIGGLSGAALMATNAYAGKTAGDTILSAGVNAAGGALVGNIAASGESVLRIEKCTVDGSDTTCLWGMIISSKDLEANQVAFQNISDSQSALVCKRPGDGDAGTAGVECESKQLVNVQLADYKDKTPEEASAEQYINLPSDKYYYYDASTKTMKTDKGGSDRTPYAKISKAGLAGDRFAAMVVGVPDKAFGMKQADWNKWRANNHNARVVGRTATGGAYTLQNTADYNIDNFYPISIGAEDGDIIDLNNKARLKGTLIGTGAGGALGAFSGYQGAQSDIEDRWVTAVREYNDSLQKVYCATGKRFLGYYNDQVVIQGLSE